ncbi:unnamed protein product, partial [Amoebophrya sp. A25]
STFTSSSNPSTSTALVPFGASSGAVLPFVASTEIAPIWDYGQSPNLTKAIVSNLPDYWAKWDGWPDQWGPVGHEVYVRIGKSHTPYGVGKQLWDLYQRGEHPILPSGAAEMFKIIQQNPAWWTEAEGYKKDANLHAVAMV